MKHCVNCGAEMSDDENFCGKCGTGQPEGMQQTAGQPVCGNGINGAAVKKSPTWFWFLVGILIIGAVITAVVLIMMPKTVQVDIGQYANATFSGIDGKGNCTPGISTDGLYTELYMKLGKDKNRMINVASFLRTVYIDLEDPTQAGTLKNGDSVTLKINYDENLAKTAKLKLTDTEVTQTVSGLTVLTQVNPFDKVTVKFSGYSPDAGAEITADNVPAPFSPYDFKLDKTSGIKEGDTVTVTCTLSESVAEEKGYTLTETSKTFTAENLDKYILTMADISQSFMDKMKQDASDVLESYLAKNYINDDKMSSAATISERQYLGAYLVTSKNQTVGEDDFNSIYLIYNATVTPTDTTYPAKVTYFPIRFCGLTSLATGTQQYNENEGIVGDTGGAEVNGSSFLSGGLLQEYYWPRMCGYNDSAKMFNDIIVANKDTINYEMTDSLKEFGN